MEPLFAQIEERYQFTLPAEFKEFWRRGYCTIFEPGRPGPQYLMLPDLEWMPLAEIAAFQFAPFHLPGFVPFATTGGGDYWCWQPEFSSGSATRVLFCHRDRYDADIYAPDFISAIYRHILEGAAATQSDAQEIETLRRELAAAVATLRPFLSPSRQQILTEIIQRPIQTRHPIQTPPRTAPSCSCMAPSHGIVPVQRNTQPRFWRRLPGFNHPLDATHRLILFHSVKPKLPALHVRHR